MNPAQKQINKVDFPAFLLSYFVPYKTNPVTESYIHQSFRLLAQYWLYNYYSKKNISSVEWLQEGVICGIIIIIRSVPCNQR